MTEASQISHGNRSRPKDSRAKLRMHRPLGLVQRQRLERSNANHQGHDCLPLVPTIRNTSPAQTDQDSGRCKQGHRGTGPIENAQLSKRDVFGHSEINGKRNGKHTQRAEDEVEVECPGPMPEVDKHPTDDWAHDRSDQPR